MVAVPTIAFDYGSINEAISHNVDGILIKKIKHEYINSRRPAAVIDLLLDNREFARRIGKAARSKVINNFTWEKHINMLLNIYNELILK